MTQADYPVDALSLRCGTRHFDIGHCGQDATVSFQEKLATRELRQELSLWDDEAGGKTL